MDTTKILPAITSVQLPYFNRLDWRKAILAIAVTLAVIDFLHYSTASGISQLHAIYRYFYFLPIVYAALRFGLWGGLIATFSASLVFIPHILSRWQDHPVESLNDLLVVVVLFGVAFITGRTADWMREAQDKQAAIAKQLSESLHQLESQGDELRRAERLISLGTLAGGLAHQIRNPVGIIRASSQLLDNSSSDGNAEIASVIQDEADRIEQLVSRLLNYAGERAIERNTTDIDQLFAQVQRRVRVAAEPLGINIVVDCAKNVTTWDLDTEQMEHALVNLCMNAIQALEESESSNRAVDSESEIRLRAQLATGSAGWLELNISDNGLGVPEHVQSHIFDPFYTTKDLGVGLGLSVVQRIVEDHDGSVRLHSPNQDGGATFTIHLPGTSRSSLTGSTRLTMADYGAYNPRYR